MSVKTKKGITLVEFSIALAIFSTTVLVGVLIFSSILQLNGRGQAVRNSQQTGRYIMERITRDIRLTNAASVNAGGHEIELANPYRSSSTVSYRFNEPNNTVERHECTDDAICTPWASIIDDEQLRVTDLDFEELSGNNRGSIEITLALEHGVEGAEVTNPTFYQYELNTVATLRQ